MFSPRPRFRFYGTPGVYLSTARQMMARAVGDTEDMREALEQRVADYLGVSRGVCVPQARFGIYLILDEWLEPDRPEVVMSPYTIHDVVNMVLCAGGQPVFADIDRATCNISAQAIARKLGPRTGAVMVTHLHGLACDMPAIMKVCDEARVPVLEDAAQALGARSGGRPVGSIGAAGVLSFGRAKNLNSFYGGMVVTSDDTLARKLEDRLAALPEEDTARLGKRIANCAIGDLVTFPPIFAPLTFRLFRYAAVNGVESVNRVVQTENEPTRKQELPEHYLRRMTAMQARLVYDQFPRLDANAEERIATARIYHEGLAGQKGIDLPPFPEDGSHVFLQYPVQVPDRWDYVRYMMQNGRDVAIQHMASAAELDIFEDFASDCLNARTVADRVVLLPTYPGYGQNEARANVEVTRRYLESA